MSEMEKLAAMMRDKQQKSEKAEATQQKVIATWKAAVYDLVHKVELWVEPLKKDGLVKTSIKTTEVRENPVGSGVIVYQAESITIEAGSSKLKLTPTARFIMGGGGRVDIQAIGARLPGETFLVRNSKDNDENDSWSLVTKGSQGSSKPQMQDFTETTLAQLLQALI